MTDVTTKKPLRVLGEGYRPYIRLPLDQAKEVSELLKNHEVRHWVAEDALSMDGGPYRTTIDLGRDADAKAIQAILDSVP